MSLLVMEVMAIRIILCWTMLSLALVTGDDCRPSCKPESLCRASSTEGRCPSSDVVSVMMTSRWQMTTTVTPQEHYTDSNISWVIHQGFGSVITQFTLEITSLDGENQDVLDACHTYDFTADTQINFEYSCDLHRRLKYFASLHDNHQRLQHQQHVIISTKEEYKQKHEQTSKTAESWLTQLVIVNDSCSQTVVVSLLQAPDEFSFTAYTVTLKKADSLFCNNDCLHQDVRHISNSTFAKATFTGVELSQSYGVQVVPVDEFRDYPDLCICRPGCEELHAGKGCKTTTYSSFYMPANHSSCQHIPPSTAVPESGGSSPPYTNTPTPQAPKRDIVSDIVKITTKSTPSIFRTSTTINTISSSAVVSEPEKHILPIVLGICGAIVLIILLLLFCWTIRSNNRRQRSDVRLLSVADHEYHQDLIHCLADLLEKVAGCKVVVNILPLGPALTGDNLQAWLESQMTNQEDENTPILFVCSKGAFASVGKEPVDSLSLDDLDNKSFYQQKIKHFEEKTKFSAGSRKAVIALLKFPHISSDYTEVYVPGKIKTKHFSLMEEFSELVKLIHGSKSVKIDACLSKSSWCKSKAYKKLQNTVDKARQFEKENIYWFEKQNFGILDERKQHLPQIIYDDLTTYHNAIDGVANNNVTPKVYKIDEKQLNICVEEVNHDGFPFTNDFSDLHGISSDNILDSSTFHTSMISIPDSINETIIPPAKDFSNTCLSQPGAHGHGEFRNIGLHGLSSENIPESSTLHGSLISIPDTFNDIIIPPDKDYSIRCPQSPHEYDSTTDDLFNKVHIINTMSSDA